MKQRRSRKSSFLFFAFWAMLSIACKTSEKTLPQIIPGSWEVYNFEADKNSMNESMLRAAEKLARSVRYEFKEDFSYEIFSDTQPNGEFGRWDWNPNKKELRLIIDDEKQEISVTKMEENTIIFESNEPPFGKVKTFLRRRE